MGWSRTHPLFAPIMVPTAHSRSIGPITTGRILSKSWVAGLTNGSGTATIASFSVAPDGVKLAFSANCPDANIYEVFVLDLTSSSADPIQVSDVGALKPPSGLSGLAFQSPINWSPDSEELAVVADWRLDTNDQDDAFSAFLLPTAAPGGLRVVGAPQRLRPQRSGGVLRGRWGESHRPGRPDRQRNL